MENATSVDGQHAWTAQIDSIVTQDLALPNPAPRLPYLVPRRQSIKVASLSLTLYLSFSFSLPLVFVYLLRLSVRLWVSWLSRALSILDSQFAVSIKNDYPMEDRSTTFLGNRGYWRVGSNRVARLAASSAALCAYTRGPSTSAGSAATDRWYVHQDSPWAHIRISLKLCRSYVRSLVSFLLTTVDPRYDTTLRDAKSRRPPAVSVSVSLWLA